MLEDAKLLFSTVQRGGRPPPAVLQPMGREVQCCSGSNPAVDCSSNLGTISPLSRTAALGKCQGYHSKGFESLGRTKMIRYHQFSPEFSGPQFVLCLMIIAIVIYFTNSRKQYMQVEGAERNFLLCTFCTSGVYHASKNHPSCIYPCSHYGADDDTSAEHVI